MTHEVVLHGYNVKPGSLQLGTFDSYGIEKIHVTADDEWAGLGILAVFHAPNGTATKVVAGADGMLAVPPEATAKQAGVGRIVFVGLSENVQRITVDMGYNIKPHSDIEGDNPGTPTPDVVQQILTEAQNANVNSAKAKELATDAKDIAQSVRDDADNGKFNGKDGAKGDKGDVGTTPQLKIGEDNLWQVSYDNGATWVSLGVKATGDAGKDGVTPHIGENGNWWLGDIDTGVSAKGPKGDPGPQGPPGEIPEDYPQIREDVSKLKEDTAALKKRQNVLVGSETGNPISRNDAYSAPLCGLTVYGKSTQDGTPSPDNPVPIVSAGDDGSVAVKVTGKNLFPVITNANISKINKPTGGVRYGYVFYVPAQSSVTASGNADIGTNCFVGDFDIKTQTYTQKAQLVSEKGGTYTAKLQSGWYVIYIANDYLPTILTKLNAAKIQLEIGTKATVYEPYREQLLTLPTPNGLPGIPVTSGGNYTDQNGQQWVCDEVDLERGVKVQRVNIVDLSTCVITGTTNLVVTKRLAIRLPLEGRDYKAKALCNKLKFIVSFTEDTLHFYVDTFTAQVFIPIGAKNPEEGEYILFYVLATPIETPLTPAEIAAYKAITAYAPDTVVQASDGAGIKLDYQRDVNLVVKNLEDAIASMTTT